MTMDNARRFRVAVGISAMWGVALSVPVTCTLGLGLATGLLPASAFGARALIAIAARGFAVGAIAGGLFAWLVPGREHSQLPPNASTRGVALWRFVVAGSVPTILALAASDLALPISVFGTAGLVAGAVGGLLGAGMLRIAKRLGIRRIASDYFSVE
jgi:hypothetical protein